MSAKRRELYVYDGSQVRDIRGKLKWSRSRAATYLSVNESTMRHYEKKGISNGVVAQRLKAIALSNGINFNG